MSSDSISGSRTHVFDTTVVLVTSGKVFYLIVEIYGGWEGSSIVNFKFQLPSLPLHTSILHISIAHFHSAAVQIDLLTAHAHYISRDIHDQ